MDEGDATVMDNKRLETNDEDTETANDCVVDALVEDQREIIKADKTSIVTVDSSDNSTDEIQTNSDTNNNNNNNNNKVKITTNKRKTKGQQQRRKFGNREIIMIQSLIERCIMMYGKKEEVIEVLETRCGINSEITRVIWNKLEQQNKAFFAEYNERLKLKDRIEEFNVEVCEFAKELGVFRTENDDDDNETNEKNKIPKIEEENDDDDEHDHANLVVTPSKSSKKMNSSLTDTPLNLNPAELHSSNDEDDGNDFIPDENLGDLLQFEDFEEDDVLA